MECLKQKKTSHSSSDLLKILVKMGGARWTDFLSLKELTHILITDRQCWWRVRGEMIAGGSVGYVMSELKRVTGVEVG